MKTTTLLIFIAFILIIAIIAGIDIYKTKVSKTSHFKYNKKSSISAYLLLLPASILAFFFVLLPILYSLGYAFTDFYLLEPDNIKFNNFKNFTTIFNDIAHKGELYSAIKNTAIFVIGGGVSKAGEVLLSYIEKNFKELAFFANKTAEFALASLGNDAGIIGAAKLALDNQ